MKPTDAYWASLFNDKGELNGSADLCFDEDGAVKSGLYYYLRQNLDKYPASSRAVEIYYAEAAADNTHGNYTARILWQRGL